ncbi:hypothetical protein Sjap_015878 [Stephania japonica]|uniref:glutathione transferase n=1 Tax=Stephania japonica TaxID=461633 RepID=A0AAP0IJY0_9MAGN
MGELKVIGAWTSPVAIRPRIALTLKSIDYEYIEENLRAKSDLLLKSNRVHKKVPVLLHGGRPIFESLVILQYIDEQWSSSPSLLPVGPLRPRHHRFWAAYVDDKSLVILQYIDEQWSSSPSILPSDPYDRAIARFWAAYVDDKVLGFPIISCCGGDTKGAERGGESRGIGASECGVGAVGEGFEGLWERRGVLWGREIGYVDIAFGSNLGWVRVVESMGEVKLLDEERTPGLVGWAERFCSHEAVKDVIPETEKLIEVAKLFSKPA